MGALRFVFFKEANDVQFLYTLELTLEKISRRTKSTVKHFAVTIIYLPSRTGYDLPVVEINSVLH